MVQLIFVASAIAMPYCLFHFNLQRMRLNEIDRQNQTDRREVFYIRNLWLTGVLVSLASVSMIAILYFM